GTQRGHRPRPAGVNARQLLSPSSFFAHQPRLGWAGSSLDDTEITGAGADDAAGAAGVSELGAPTGARSRMVERRRGASGSSAGGGLLCGGGNSASAVGGGGGSAAGAA